jgi:hypothetical protein
MHVAAVLLVALAGSAMAQGQGAQPGADTQELSKWSAAKVARYHLDGKGPQAADSVVLDFDWDLKEHRIVGAPKIRNGAKSSLQVATLGSGPGARIRLEGNQSMELPMPSPMLLALPPGPSMNIAITPDRKSFVVKAAGWSWTFTPALP